jgi:hypothetical protein
MKITPVLHRAPLKSLDEKMNDLNYWLSQPLIKRLEAVTFLISHTVDLKTTRMDKSHVMKKTESMTLAQDFEDFVKLLNKHQVDYMVVGGYELAFHGKPRHTGDLDIWINT